MDRGEFFQKAFKLTIGKSIEWITENPIIVHLEDLATEKQRPPGASPENQFKDLCTGCDQCMIACPVNIIMIEDQETRLPLIFPEKEPCIHCDGYPCIQTCPTGALNYSFGTSLRFINKGEH